MSGQLPPRCVCLIPVVVGEGLEESIERLERKLVMEAMYNAQGNKSVAARTLKTTRRSLYRLLIKHGLDSKRDSWLQRESFIL